MTYIQFTNRPSKENFNNRGASFPHRTASNNRFANAPSEKQVAVNVSETADAFKIEVLAPGFEKEAFKIDLDKNLLTISATAKEVAEEAKQLRKEFEVNAFKRSFFIEKNMDAEAITASYQNGILNLALPKKPELKPVVKKIAVA